MVRSDLMQPSFSYKHNEELAQKVSLDQLARASGYHYCTRLTAGAASKVALHHAHDEPQLPATVLTMLLVCSATEPAAVATTGIGHQWHRHLAHL